MGVIQHSLGNGIRLASLLNKWIEYNKKVLSYSVFVTWLVKYFHAYCLNCRKSEGQFFHFLKKDIQYKNIYNTSGKYVHILHSWGVIEAQVDLIVTFSSSGFVSGCFSSFSWHYLDEIVSLWSYHPTCLSANQARWYNSQQTSDSSVSSVDTCSRKMASPWSLSADESALKSYLRGLHWLWTQWKTEDQPPWTPADDIPPQIVTDCGNFTLALKYLGFCASLFFIH